MSWEAPQRLSDVFPDAIEGVGIFHYLEELDVPWKQDVDSTSLDLLYHVERSDDKFVSPLVSRLFPPNSALNYTSYQKLAKAIFTKYSVRWSKLYQTLSLEYNPIENYNMVENEDINVEGKSQSTSNNTRTNNLQRTRKNEDSDTESGTVNVASSDTGTVGVTGSSQEQRNQNVYGFNSSTAVPSDTGTSSGSNNSTTTNNLAGSRDETRELVFGHNVDETIEDTGSVKDEGGGSVEHNDTTGRKLTRSGNIGVTTSQKMIESERNLWIWDFFEDVFKDLDKLLVLPIF